MHTRVRNFDVDSLFPIPPEPGANLLLRNYSWNKYYTRESTAMKFPSDECYDIPAVNRTANRPTDEALQTAEILLKLTSIRE